MNTINLSLMRTIDLGINLQAELDLAHALTLIDATKLLRGRRGAPAYNTVMRWARPNQGYSVGMVRVVLPTVLLNGVRWTMPAWVRAFEQARTELGVNADRRRPS